jgi:class 3 adenylate cyclase/CHASE2 domain-containing sensor protein
VKARGPNWIPFLVGGVVVLLTITLQLLPGIIPAFDVFHRLEWMTFDWRVRRALAFPAPTASNLAAVFIDDETLEEAKEIRPIQMGAGWPFYRQIHGAVLRELHAQGARVVGVDIIFDQLRKQDPPVVLSKQTALALGFSAEQVEQAPYFQPPVQAPGQTQKPLSILIESDDFFSFCLRQSRNVVLAALPKLLPHPAFMTNALAIGHVEGSKAEASEQDSDGILRRFKAFDTFRLWHPAIRAYAEKHHLSLDSAQINESQIQLRDVDEWKTHVIRMDSDRFRFRDGDGSVELVPVNPGTRPFADTRLWQMGIVLAARQLNLDLDRAEIDSSRGRIVLPGPAGMTRTIPIDSYGRFLIDWNLTWNDPRILSLSYSAVVTMDELRHDPEGNSTNYLYYLQELRKETGKSNWIGDFPFRDKLVIIGSTMTGNNLSDLGPSPLSKQTFLISAHWNVANSLITGRFVRTAPLWVEILFGCAICALGFFVTWRSRVVWASVWILAIAIVYALAGLVLYVQFRFWLPLVMPLLSLLLLHASLETYWLVFAQKEQRRVKAIFSKLVSPDVVDELLQEERLALGGARRPVTVYFADVRGFTEFTDVGHARAEEFVRQKGLDPRQAEVYLDEHAREVLATINLYLGTVANVVKKHHGTLDKYIGDCVMAFWGAPTPNPNHALSCVQAAIEAQREIHQLNRERQADNKRRESENLRRQTDGQAPFPLLPLLSFGTGINTGIVTVGLMGSDEHILNYTVFGREVNLASRLETVSGRDRILVSAATFAEIQRLDPALAEGFVKQPLVYIKGFIQPIEIYEAPWKLPVAAEPVPGTADSPTPTVLR